MLNICEHCLNESAGCPMTSAQICNCLEQNMIAELKELGFDFTNPTYKKLSSSLSQQVRAIYSKYYNMLNLDPSKPIYTHDGQLIATGFERVVIGDYGAYLEYDLSQVKPHGIVYTIEKGQEYRVQPYWRKRVKYIWYTLPNSNPHIKIYWQLRTVSYADYLPKKFYISPFQVRQ